MNGYIKNASGGWKHVMKRNVAPGEEIDLNVIYEQYGKKNKINEGEEFVTWLRNIKLKNEKDWLIITKDKDELTDQKDTEEVTIKTATSDDMTKVEIKNLTIRDLVDLPVRTARNVIPKVSDLNLLRYAYKEANQLSNKESLCRILRKRIEEVQIIR